MKVSAIIQARMASTRLPGKVLMKLAGESVIKLVFARARAIRGVTDALVATTVSVADDTLADYCLREGIPVFRGAENDVLDRYVQAARMLKSDVVIRITADCPFLDPVESAKVLDLFLSVPGCDYSSNARPPFLPDGLDTEVISVGALERIAKEATDAPSREHVTYYTTLQPEKFAVRNLTGTPDLSNHRWTLDEPADYDMLSAVRSKLNERNQFGYVDEILSILRDHPEIAAINQRIQRNEGLQKSLKEHMAKQY